VTMALRKDVHLVRYKLVSLVYITYTLSHYATKIVEMELGLTLRNAIIKTIQVAQLIVKLH
jgi:hypothetical protein